jgi:hypothetical protein
VFASPVKDSSQYVIAGSQLVTGDVVGRSLLTRGPADPRADRLGQHLQVAQRALRGQTGHDLPVVLVQVRAVHRTRSQLVHTPGGKSGGGGDPGDSAEQASATQTGPFGHQVSSKVGGPET